MEFANMKPGVSKTQGNIGAARAVYEFTKMGYTVLVPLSDSDKYDIVVDNGMDLLKVQVKTSQYKSTSGGYSVNLKTSGGNTKSNTIIKRKEGDYDLLFVLTELGDCWIIPETALDGAGNSIVVGAKKYNEYKLDA